jgi:hypothetical protein
MFDWLARLRRKHIEAQIHARWSDLDGMVEFRRTTVLSSASDPRWNGETPGDAESYVRAMGRKLGPVPDDLEVSLVRFRRLTPSPISQ